MNRKFLSGTFGMLLTLAIVGTAGTAQITSGDPTLPNLRSEYGVPVRSGKPADVKPTKGLKPVAIRVGDIGLEAPVIPVGVDADRRLNVPSANLVGWYQYSPTPGSAGASVLAAHVDYGGEQGAFFNLHKLAVGERFELELEDGSVRLYEVSGNTIYDKVELPSAELFRKDGEPVLQLVTCGGTFDVERRAYDANVVVSAVPI